MIFHGYFTYVSWLEDELSHCRTVLSSYPIGDEVFYRLVMHMPRQVSKFLHMGSLNMCIKHLLVDRLAFFGPLRVRLFGVLYSPLD